jgi:hypothetical protein
VAVRFATPRTAALLGALIALLFFGTIPVALAGHDMGGANGASQVVLVAAFGLVGVAVAWSRARNPIGWCLLGAGGFLMLSDLGSTYSVLDYRIHHGSLPLGPVAVMIQPGWAPAIVLLALSIVLFPDGELPSGRWRGPMGLFLGVGLVWLGGAFAIALGAIAGNHVDVLSSGDLRQIDYPSGSWAWWGDVQNLWFLLLGLIGFAWLASRVPAYRQATGDRRQQLKWLIAGGTVAVLGGVFSVMLSNSGGVAGVVARLAVIGILGIPLGIGIGVLKYRLYDIDRIVSRTVTYALLTAALVGVFAGLVLLTTRVLPFSSPVGVAASTLAAAALFTPLRGRLQGLVDRRFNRARYDADALVAAYGARLRDAVDLDAVKAGLLETAALAVEPAHVSVWLRD